MKCFVCNSNDVICTKEYDIMCSMKIVTLCICDRCGAEWYDETL